jgi:hypothetical protein
MDIAAFESMILGGTTWQPLDLFARIAAGRWHIQGWFVV